MKLTFRRWTNGPQLSLFGLMKGLGIALVAARQAKLDVTLMDKDPKALEKSIDFLGMLFRSP